MSEEIIIDGVNVTECELRSDIYKNLLADGIIKEFYNYCYINNDGCYGINCYYKQLKRLEQKYNEVLKLSKEGMDAQEYCLQEDEEIIRNLKEEHSHYIDIINELKKENEKLEEALKPFKDDYFKNLSNEQIAELAKKSIRLTTENRELENRLEIADKQIADEEAKHYAMEEEIEQLKALKDTYFTCYKAKHDDVKGEFFELKKENENLKERLKIYENGKM